MKLRVKKLLFILILAVALIVALVIYCTGGTRRRQQFAHRSKHACPERGHDEQQGLRARMKTVTTRIGWS